MVKIRVDETTVRLLVTSENRTAGKSCPLTLWSTKPADILSGGAVESRQATVEANTRRLIQRDRHIPTSAMR
jgi:hypothetical protein